MVLKFVLMKNLNKLVECNGSAFCIHETRKNACLICSPHLACENCKMNIKGNKHKTILAYNKKALEICGENAKIHFIEEN